MRTGRDTDGSSQLDCRRPTSEVWAKGRAAPAEGRAVPPTRARRTGVVTWRVESGGPRPVDRRRVVAEAATRAERDPSDRVESRVRVAPESARDRAVDGAFRGAHRHRPA